MEDDRSDELLFNTLARVGDRRCRNKAKRNSSAIVGADRQALGRAHLLNKWRHLYTETQLESLLMELLCRAEALVKFLNSNAGPTVEFPVVITAETQETADIMQECRESLTAVVNMLLEI